MPPFHRIKSSHSSNVAATTPSRPAASTLTFCAFSPLRMNHLRGVCLPSFTSTRTIHTSATLPSASFALTSVRPRVRTMSRGFETLRRREPRRYRGSATAARSTTPSRASNTGTPTTPALWGSLSLPTPTTSVSCVYSCTYRVHSCSVFTHSLHRENMESRS